MHEMSLCESLIQVIEEQATTQGYNQVKTVFLEIGAFSGIETDAMQFCFDVVCRGTLADGATLTINQLPGKAWCFDCQQEVEVHDRLDACPQCQGFSLQTSGGEEMTIKQLEVI
jgi:hydrogenase nickel incorporation protein HypA/HybF